jgi:nicotinamide-nucleotide adenylyltransferase
MERALFVGRFQPIHHGHFEVIKKMLNEFEEIILVVGSAESLISSDNPFTTGERIEMVRSTFNSELLNRIIIVPVRDMNDHARWVNHVRSYVPSFDVVFSNNELVTKLFQEAGVEVKPIEFIDRGKFEGKFIRSLMSEGNPEWKKHVPKQVAQIIEKINGVQRLRKMKGE